MQALSGTVRADTVTADLPTMMHWALDDTLPSLAVSLLQRTPSLAHAGLPDAGDTVLGVAMARGAAVAEATDTLQDLVMNRLEGTHTRHQPTLPFTFRLTNKPTSFIEFLALLCVPSLAQWSRDDLARLLVSEGRRTLCELQARCVSRCRITNGARRT